MPLRPGSSQTVISQNIRELLAADQARSQAQAVAIAESEADKMRKRKKAK